MFDNTLPPTTAGIFPECFAKNSPFTPNGVAIVCFLACIVIFGLGLRVWNLGAESLSEDELNKLQTVQEYRADGLSGRNGEHPFLMKGMQTMSVIGSEKLNGWLPELQISGEAALRFPTALFGAFSALLLYFLVNELFGSFIGLISAMLYAVDPNAIGFDRIAKEDSFLLFFFLLANVFWMRSQSVAETGKGNPVIYYFAAAAAFGAMVASKYLPHLIGISAAYYNIFQTIPATKWRLGKLRWLAFFGVMAVAFIICNPTLLVPETWRQMIQFLTEKRIGHDAYEFMGHLYPNQMTKWLSGVPWTFYFVFIFVKTPLVTLILFLIGLPLAFNKKLGDGRYFLFFWMLFWFLPFAVLGGKFTRYYTVAQPVIFIVAAVGFVYITEWLKSIKYSPAAIPILILGLLIWIGSLSLAASPHFRLFTNSTGIAYMGKGSFFPHDEFYDMSTRDAAVKIAALAQPGASIASETPYVFQHYVEMAGRSDIAFVSLSDKNALANLKAGDFIPIAEGRRYFSNDEVTQYLKKSAVPVAEIKAGGVISVRIYQIDEDISQEIRSINNGPFSSK
ncbi:MAG: glycosyltransferase family 39 protein [Saprospiraceae bacterium]|nr:glycosyltransferase family 39 protein [Pyrinomonadaceae bacterium]